MEHGVVRCAGEIRQLVVFTVYQLPTLRVRMKDFHITYLKAVGGGCRLGEKSEGNKEKNTPTDTV